MSKTRKPCDLWLTGFGADGRKLAIRRRYAAIKNRTSEDVKNVAKITRLTPETVRAIERSKTGEPLDVTLTSFIRYLAFCELDIYDVIVPIEKGKEVENAKSKDTKND